MRSYLGFDNVIFLIAVRLHESTCLYVFVF